MTARRRRSSLFGIRRGRFSLRFLFVVTSIGCVAAACLQARESSLHRRDAAARRLLRTDRCVESEPASAWAHRIDVCSLVDSNRTDCWLGLAPGFRVRAIDLAGLRVSEELWQAAEALPEVRTLRLRQGTVDSERLRSLGGFTELRRLDLAATGVDDEALEHVGRVAWLRELDLADTRVSDRGLSRLWRLQRLERLNLDGTQVTDAGLEHLARLQSLAEVRLYRTRVTPEGVARLDAALPCCVRHNPVVLGPADELLTAAKSGDRRAVVECGRLGGE